MAINDDSQLDCSDMVEPSFQESRDICRCGDYRYQHDERGCILCRNFGPLKCEKFIKQMEPGD